MAQGLVADCGLGFQSFLDTSQDLPLPVEIDALGGPGALGALVDAAQTALDDLHVGEGELQQHRLRVAERVYAVVHGGDRGVGEGTHHQQQGVGGLHQVEVFSRDAPRCAEAFWRRRQVNVAHLGRHDPFGLVDACQHVEPGVCHLGHADVGPVRVGGDLRMSPGDRVEYRRLTAPRQADYGYVHGTGLP